MTYYYHYSTILIGSYILYIYYICGKKNVGHIGNLLYIYLYYGVDIKIVIFCTSILHNTKFLINPDVMYRINFLNKKVIRRNVFKRVVYIPYN